MTENAGTYPFRARDCHARESGVQYALASRHDDDPTTARGGVYWIPALASLRSLGRNDGE
jgi:hypothetical protein